MKGSFNKKRVLKLRSEVCQAIRDFFKKNGYIEVETPYLIPSPMPESHIDAFKSDGAYLHTSPELCMKRLICSGYERIFQICRVFRKGERGRFHLPEFTMLEWYRTGTDYNEIMEECQNLIIWVNKKINKAENINYNGNTIELTPPWDRVSLKPLFQSNSPMSMDEAIKSGNYETILINRIEPTLPIHGPVFVIDYPTELSPLARAKKSDPSLAERFELYIGGMEIANGFSELNDPKEQRKRLEKENLMRLIQNKEPYPMPEKFLEELSNLPPCSGVALGVDRLLMLVADCNSIEDVIALPPESL